jgi:hypothetical protein
MDLPNLHVVKAMLSLKSRGYVREVFNWCVEAVLAAHSQPRAISFKGVGPASPHGSPADLWRRHAKSGGCLLSPPPLHPISHPPPPPLFLCARLPPALTKCVCRQWHYFFLTDAGIQYLKEYLHLPEDVVPATMKRGPNDATGESSVAAMGGAFGGRDGRPGRFGDRGDRPRTGAPRA